MLNLKLIQVTLILLFLSFTAEAQIRVAVEDGSATGSGTDLVAQLNDDTWADFSAVKVTASDIDSLAELANYDVVILGDSGNRNHDWTALMSTTLRDWVSAGGAAVLVGWGNYGMNTSNTIFDPLDAIFPTQNIASTNQYDSGGTIMNILQPAHPIFTGLSDFSFPTGCCIEVNPMPILDANDLQLATIGGATVVATKAFGNGSSVYLGPIYMGSVSGYSSVVPGLRSGDPDRLLEQAVSWAAGNAVAPPTTYTIGGTVTGLSGAGLELQNNGVDTLSIAADGTFTFLTELADATAYDVTVFAQPSGQTCTVANGSGTVAAANITNVTVDCVDDTPPPALPALGIPTLSGWMMILLSGLIGLLVFVNRRRVF